MQIRPSGLFRMVCEHCNLILSSTALIRSEALGKIPANVMQLHLVRICHLVNQSQPHPDPLLSAQVAVSDFRWQVLDDALLCSLALQRLIPTTTDRFLVLRCFGLIFFHWSLIKNPYCYCLSCSPPPQQCTRLACFSHTELFMQEFVKSVRPEPSLAGPVNPDNEIKVAAGARCCSLVWMGVRGILPEFQS